MAEEDCEHCMFPDLPVFKLKGLSAVKIPCRKIARRMMNEDVAYARNTESGCNKERKS